MKVKLNIKCPKCNEKTIYYVEVKILFKKYFYHACKQCGYLKNIKELKQELQSR